MKKGKIAFIAMAIGILSPSWVMADDYVDDIYFNPKKDKTVGAAKKNPNYIENFGDMDVDAYNLRGQYYNSPVDTIGNGVSQEDDFVYTQQIQKYYNPTIVLDNEDLLADVLENSYGNVEIVYNGFTPTFLPVYGWPCYRSYYNPWAWNIGFGGWSIGGWFDPWYIGPSWSWGWGPGWGPSWGWGPGWGPSWGWGPGWHPGPGWGPAPRPNATWSPGGNRPVAPGLGWAGNHRPSGNRPAARPGDKYHSSGSNWSIGGNRRGSIGQGNATNAYGGNRVNGTTNRGYTIGAGGHRYTGSGNVGTGTNNGSGNRRTGTYNSGSRQRKNGSVTTNRTTTTNRGTSTRSYNNNSNSNRSTGNGSFGSGSFGGSRSTGGGSRSTGGGSRGGGGGSRGTRR